MNKNWSKTLLLSVLVFPLIAMGQDTNNTAQNTVEIMDTTTSRALICTLSGVELQERKAAIQKDIFAAIQKTSETKDGIILHFKDNDKMLLTLIDYVMVEKSCCPFMQFDLTILADGNGINLGISGVAGVKEFMIKMLEEMND